MAPDTLSRMAPMLPPAMPAPSWIDATPHGCEPVPAEVILPPPLVELGAIVAFDITSRCRTAGLRCAARIAASATTAEDWRDVASDMAHRRDTTAAFGAAAAAARRMGRGHVEIAAEILAELRGEATTREDYVATVRAEMAAAQVSP